MKFTVNVPSLVRALTLAVPLAAKRNMAPILSGVKLVANEGKLVIEATDLEQRVAIKIEDGVTIEEPGQMLVIGKTLLDYIKEVHTDEVTFKFIEDKAQVRVSSGRSRFHINVMNPQDFPSDNTTEASFFNVDGTKFINAIKKLGHFASKDTSRVYLMTACLAPGEIVTTDGHRLGIVTDDAFEITEENLLIPVAAINTLIKLFEKSESLNIAVGDNTLFFQEGSSLFTTRLITRDYPNYHAIIPQGLSRIIKGDRQEFLWAVKRLLLLQKASGSAISSLKLEFTSDEMIMSASNAAVGEGAEIIDVTGIDDGTVVGFNGNYMKEALESLKEDTFELHVGDALRPAFFEEGNYKHVIMPLKI